MKIPKLPTRTHPDQADLVSTVNTQLQSMSFALKSWQALATRLSEQVQTNSSTLISQDRALIRHSGKLGELERGQAELRNLIQAQGVQIAMLVDGIRGVEASLQAAIERQEAMLMCHLAEHEGP